VAQAPSAVHPTSFSTKEGFRTYAHVAPRKLFHIMQALSVTDSTPTEGDQENHGNRGGPGGTKGPGRDRGTEGDRGDRGGPRAPRQTDRQKYGKLQFSIIESTVANRHSALERGDVTTHVCMGLIGVFLFGTALIYLRGSSLLYMMGVAVRTRQPREWSTHQRMLLVHPKPVRLGGPGERWGLAAPMSQQSSRKKGLAASQPESPKSKARDFRDSASVGKEAAPRAYQPALAREANLWCEQLRTAPPTAEAL
jgi:hypothetical protein